MSKREYLFLLQSFVLRTDLSVQSRPTDCESPDQNIYCNWNISDFVVFSCGSPWKSWLNLLPSMFVETVSEHMMLHDCSYSRACSSTLHIKNCQWRCVLYQQQLHHAWQFGCADLGDRALGRLSTQIQFYTNYGHPPATDHSVQPSKNAVSGELISWYWMAFIFRRHEFDSHFLNSYLLWKDNRNFLFLIHFTL